MRFLFCFILMACSVKKDEPEMLIPPVDYDVDEVNYEGHELCIKTHPADATVLVSSRSVDGCIRTLGETFVEVLADGYRPYRETLNVQGDLEHEVLLLPVLSESNTTKYPMPKNDNTSMSLTFPGNSVELCVTIVPEDAYLRINGVKRVSGSCMIVQNAAEVRVESDGYTSYRQLLAISPDQASPYEVTITLEPSEQIPKGPL